MHHPARLLAGLVLAVALVLTGGRPASAHATLIASDPSSGAVLAAAPRQVLLQFDVPVDTRLGAVSLFGGDGERLDGTGIHRPGPGDSVIAVDLPPLRDGAYRLTYEVPDDTDLHESTGTIVFGIGAATGPPPARAAVPGPSVPESGTRWLALSGLCLLIGVVAVWFGVLPAVRRSPSWQVDRGQLIVLAALGYATIAAGKLGQLVVAALGLAPQTADGWPAATWSALTASRYGLLWLLCMALAATVLMAVRAVLDRPDSRLATAVLLAAVGALLLVVDPSDHGTNRAGLDPAQLLFRTVHLGAASLWVGGLTVLVVLFAGALRGGAPGVSVALAAFRRFAGLAWISVGLLAGSGLLLAGRDLGSPWALLTTTYGLTLLAKLAAGAVALALGFHHTLLLRPPRGAGVAGPARLAVTVPFEVGAMLVILWGAATLGATAPATGAVVTVHPAPAATSPALADDAARHGR